MATNARIVGTTSAATYTASASSGSSLNFMAHNLLPGESIKLLASDAGGSYRQVTFIGPGGKKRNARLTDSSASITITGPLDFRFSKELTENAVELSEYS